MRRARSGVLVLGALAVLLLAAPPPARAASSVDDVYLDGLRHLAAGDFAAAAETLSRAHAREPRAEIRVALARAWLALGRCEALLPLLEGLELQALAPEQRRFAADFARRAQSRCAAPDFAPAPAPAPSPVSVPTPAPVAPAIPPDMLRVEGGVFPMGSARGAADERPVRRVRVASFLMDRHEVRVSDFSRCLAQGACPRAEVLVTAQRAECNLGREGREDHPVNCVSWEAARAYCAWKGRRLPSEREWEYAARGSGGRLHPWGDEPPDCARCGVGGWACGVGTVPVTSRPSGATPEGLLGLCGNVLEWVADWYEARAYRRSARDGGPSSGERRVVRGAVRGRSGWVPTASPSALESAARGSAPPETRSPDLGFRCAMDAEESP